MSELLPMEEPLGEYEQCIASAWQELFHIDRIGRSDNFFALGGDSVIAAQVIERVSARFAVEMHIVSVFEHPTVRELAEAVDGLLSEDLVL